MKANAWHHRADAISSVVALIGVGETLVFLHTISISSFFFFNIQLIFGRRIVNKSA